jgi:biopolymer transport protein TolR
VAANVVSAPSGGRHRRRRRAVMSDINVTPFVDVMLVVLIVFMVSAPLMTMSINVDLPNASGGSANEADKEPLILTLKRNAGTCNAQTELYLGQSPISTAEVQSKLKAIKENSQVSSIVYVNADKDICYQDVMRALGELRNAGFKAALKILPIERE